MSRENASGIARISEIIPQGAEIKYSKSEGGSFNKENNKMNFFWMSLPTTDEFKVAYIINTEKLGVGAYAIAGKFSYVEKDEKHEVPITASNFYVSPTNEVKLDISPATASLSEKNIITSAPAVDNAGKVVYRIQVMSTAKQLPNNYFSKNFNMNEKVSVENTKGQFKYIVGEFNDLNSALKFREGLVQKGLKDSFLIAFSDNKTISLTEAKEREGTVK